MDKGLEGRHFQAVGKGSTGRQVGKLIKGLKNTHVIDQIISVSEIYHVIIIKKYVEGFTYKVVYVC